MYVKICPVSYFLFRSAFSHLWGARCSAYRIESFAVLAEIRVLVGEMVTEIENENFFDYFC